MLTACLLAACAAGQPSAPSQPAGGASRLAVSPASVSLNPGDTARFSAFLYSVPSGGSTYVAATWSASGGSIDGTGHYAAGHTAGAWLVIATDPGTGLADTAQVAIADTLAQLPSPTLTVAPDSVLLQAGDSASFTAYRHSGLPGDSTAVAALWSATGGSINGLGRYAAGGAPGTWLVIATDSVSGLRDTATVVIADSTGPPPPPSGLANECATPRPGWIWCDDFDRNRLASYFEYITDQNSFVRDSGSGNNGSWAMRAHFAPGQVSAGALHLAFGRTPQAFFKPVDGGTADYRELYWRVYLKNQAGWTGGGGDKLTRATIFASGSSWAQAMIAHVWSGGTSASRNYLVMDPASGTDSQGNLVTTTYNDFANLRWLGMMQGTTPLFSAASVGTWHCIEAHVRLNDAGASNGVFELWVDGVRQGGSTTLNWVGNYGAYGINAIFLENYWNAGSPVAQDRWLDNLVVSTAKIGC